MGHKIVEKDKLFMHIYIFAKNEKEVEILIKTIGIYSQDIGMEFEIEKCAMLIMKKGKGNTTEGIELLN